MAQDGDGTEIGAAEQSRIEGILAELTANEHELLDPPPSVWAGIEASLAKEPPARHTPTRMVVEYWIDADDVVREVGEGWADFARANDAAELVAPPADRTLWEQMASEEVADLWRLLVERVRSLEVEARVPFRCDGPAARRWFEMTLTPGPERRVKFRSVLAFEELRTPLALLDGQADRDPSVPPVAMCSWCNRGEHHGDWLDVEELVVAARLLEEPTLPPLSYGICVACSHEMAAITSTPR